MQLRIEFSPSSPKKKLEKVIEAVCAIVNSGKNGGMLILFSESCAYSQKDVDDITRKIEQKLQATFGFEPAREMITRMRSTCYARVTVREICFEIKPTTLLPLCTINYNLFVTTDTQVYEVPASERLEHVFKIIKGEHEREKKSVLGQHHKDFSFGAAMIALEENKQTQLKHLKDETSGNSTLATRMTDERNKLTHYVLGFANGSGGHIYYGIKLDENGSYVVLGQTVHDKVEIIRQVDRAISKLFSWSHEIGCLKRRYQWDIYFERVLNTEEPRYVIVVSVNSYEKGVFAKGPESFHIVDGKPKQMDFDEWRVRLLLAECQNIFLEEMRRGICIPAQSIGRCEWSSPGAREKHIDVLNNFVRLRNNGDTTKLQNYIEQLLSHGDYDENTQCLVQQQQAASLFRKGRLEEAERKLKDNEDYLQRGKAADAQLYQITRLYWTAIVKRAQGKYEECQRLCEEALQASHCQPIIIVLPWLFYNKAKLLEYDIAKQNDPTKGHNLRTTCLELYECALRVCCGLRGLPQDLVVNVLHRVLIAMAQLYLGAFYDGTHVVHKTCSSSDRDHADHLLKVLGDSVQKQGCPMTRLNEAYCMLVRAELFYRSCENASSGKAKFISLALEESNKALNTALAKNFKDISQFAEGQIKVFQEFVQP